MEYLMTYGWAILVVMVAGVALWQLGIFNMGGSVLPTANGFNELKPILQTCKGFVVYSGTTKRYGGFTCHFANVVDTGKRVKYLYVRLNDKACFSNQLGYKDKSNAWWTIVSKCYDASCTRVNTECAVRYNSSSRPAMARWMHEPDCTPTFHGDGIPIPIDGTVRWASYDAVTNNYRGECLEMNEGEMVRVSVDIVYNNELGGVMTKKHDIGTMSMPVKNMGTQEFIKMFS
jgi:hypothetical protein